MLTKMLRMQISLAFCTLCIATTATADYYDGLAAVVKGDYETACREFKAAAEQGNANAQIKLGSMHGQGMCVPKSDTEAFKWLRMAAEQKSAEGQHRLGLMYLNGIGVAKSEEEALKWFQLAAAQDYIDSQVTLANLYSAGIRVKQNYDEALKWYRKSASLGNPFAMRKLGEMSWKGQGVPKDNIQAYMWAILALDFKDAAAGDMKFMLKKVMKPEQIVEAEKLAEKWKKEKGKK